MVIHKLGPARTHYTPRISYGEEHGRAGILIGSVAAQARCRTLDEEAEPVAILLGETDQTLLGLGRRTDLLAKGRDDLRVQSDPLAAKLLDLLVPQDNVADAHRRREDAVRKRVGEDAGALLLLNGRGLLSRRAHRDVMPMTALLAHRASECAALEPRGAGRNHAPGGGSHRRRHHRRERKKAGGGCAARQERACVRARGERASKACVCARACARVLLPALGAMRFRPARRRTRLGIRWAHVFALIRYPANCEALFLLACAPKIQARFVFFLCRVDFAF